MTKADLTPKQAAGQRIMAGFYGTGLTDDLKFLIGQVRVGGIILFARNIENRSQLKELCADVQNHARECGQPPLFIAIDQEGGCVSRLRPPEFPEFPGAPDIQNINGAIVFGNNVSRELKTAGINMNMAPVLDVAPPSIDSIMKDRMFNHDPLTVAKIGSTIIDTMQKNGIMAIAKHFPGIGRTVSDSHMERPDLETPLDYMDQFDLIPFKSAIRHHVSGIMLSHVRYTAIDPAWPASLSITIALSLLREKLGFDGLVMTDDLDMGAIKNHYGIETVGQRIIEAGIDIALICHSMNDVETMAGLFEKQLRNPGNFRDKGMESVNRIMEMKSKFLSMPWR